MLYKFINEGKQEHEEIRAFINEFRTTNELLFKERNNSLSELRFEVHVLLRVSIMLKYQIYEVKGVTTRGGKTTTQDIQNDNTNMHTEEPLVVNHDKPVEPKEVLVKNQHQKTNELVVQPSIEVQTPSIHFLEALAQMPKHANFLKGLLTNKAILEEACTINMNERCSAVLLNKLPSKEKDPGSFTIPCDIGQLHINNALANLRASINRSIQYPRGIVENVLIKVDKFVLPIDFIILDMLEDSRPPNEDDECFGIDDLDDTINMETQKLLGNDNSDSFLLKGLEKSINQSNLESSRPDGVKSEHLYSSSTNEIDEKKLELKILPCHIEYAYLHGDKSFPIIISSKLSEKEKMLLLQVRPIHVVSKKGGMTIVLNDDNELIPSRTVTEWQVMLARCEETNLVLNWKKCHFMVKEDIVLGHKNSRAGIEVDRAKIDVIAKLPYPTNVKGDRSFLGHPGFYHSKLDAKPRLIRWVLLLQGFDIEIKDKKIAENLAVDHLSRLDNPDLGAFTEEEIADEFLDEHLMILKAELNDDEPFKMHPRKLKSKWYGPNVVKIVYPYGTVEITDKNGISFKVSGQRLKKYYNGHIDMDDKEVIEFK
ncbi:hypothetical protein Tco_1115240 [Tanacetum coccineum]